MATQVKKFNLREVIDEAIASGITPLELMLQIMREPIPGRAKGEDPSSYRSRVAYAERYRLEAAKAAAPYVHPKIATEVVLGGLPDTGPREIDITDLARKVAFLFAMAENQKPKQLQ